MISWIFMDLKIGRLIGIGCFCPTKIGIGVEKS
jgi:hypothetical protein